MNNGKARTRYLVTKKYETTSVVNNKVDKFPVTHLAFNSDNSILLLSDELGNVTLWDLTNFIMKLDDIKDDTMPVPKKTEQTPNKSSPGFFPTEVDDQLRLNEKQTVTERKVPVSSSLISPFSSVLLAKR